MILIPEAAVHGVCYRTGPLTVDDYNEAIKDLMSAKSDLVYKIAGRPVDGCFICEDSGHTAESCHHNPLLLARERAAAKSVWQCWHCGYEARTEADAIEHFGRTEDEIARCISAAPLAPPDGAVEAAVLTIIKHVRNNAPSAFYGNGCTQHGWDMACDTIAAAIFARSAAPQPKGDAHL